MIKPLTSDEVLNVIGEHYQLDDIDYCMFLTRGFNDSYVLEVEGDRYIFRVYAEGKYYIKSDDAYRFELKLLEHLKKQGVPVAAVVSTAKGELLGIEHTKDGRRKFALFQYADGYSLSRNAVTTVQSYQMGVALAKLHLASNSFESKFQRYELDLKYLVNEPVRLITEGKNHADNSGLIERGQYVIEKLQPLKKYIDRVNSIGTGNVHFRGDELTIFDFDHCAYGWRAYDLAISSGLPKAQKESMIEGYESQRPLSQEEKDSLQDLSNLRNLWDVGDTLATVNLNNA